MCSSVMYAGVVFSALKVIDSACLMEIVKVGWHEEIGMRVGRYSLQGVRGVKEESVRMVIVLTPAVAICRCCGECHDGFYGKIAY